MVDAIHVRPCSLVEYGQAQKRVPFFMGGIYMYMLNEAHTVL